MRQLLFVCTGNTCRSPMAAGMMAALLAEQGREDVVCVSAGTAAFSGDPPSENAVRVMQEKGIDISAHRARRISYELLGETDVIYCMSGSHRDALCAAAPFAAPKIRLISPMGISDPYGGSMDRYRRARDQIEAALRRLIEEGTWEK